MTAPASEDLERARDAFARHAWADAFRAFHAAAERADLDAADHERRAISAYLVGEDEVCAAAWEAAHRDAQDGGDAAGAARCAFWVAFSFMMRGQMAQAGGWLARAEHLVAEAAPECAAAGYLRIPAILGALDAGDPAAARDLAVEAAELGARFADPDLRAFGLLGHGQALIAMGAPDQGVARLDEVMVSVTGGEVGPVTSGIVYCAVILECMQLFDLQRASEWTDALSAWCEAQPDLVPYRGQCLVHRSQLQQATGAWRDAVTTVEAACRRLTEPPHPALGLAHYQEAELRRLLGEFDAADNAYRLASRHGYDPMPGLALLELARGDAEAAAASIQRALQERGSTFERPPLLAAAVDILRTLGDAPGVRRAADELASIAGARGSSGSSGALAAMAAQAAGAALLAEGEAAAALDELRTAASRWQSLHMPYEQARTAVLRGLACAALGDRTAARLEFDNAGEAFTQLGAVPDLERLTALTRGLVSRDTSGAALLSTREREVLAHVAAGKTNREIADELVISQHTVGRHVENIFTKLGVTSRAAATAYAYEHSLL